MVSSIGGVDPNLLLSDADSPVEGGTSLYDLDSPASNLYSSYPNFCYPGSGDNTFSSCLFTTLYEEDEFRELCCRMEGSPMTSPEIDRSFHDVYPTRPTIYHVLRMFDSIRGFHQGYLDLSGRHPDRYYALQSQWNRYLSHFLNLETEILTCEELNAIGIPNGYHVVHDTRHWRLFQTKWRIPHSTSYAQLLKCTQRVLREIKRRPVPNFQKIRLTDLPAEVLDNIVKFAPTPHAKLLACTCRLLNEISQRHIFRSWQMKLQVPSEISPFNAEYSSFNLPTVAEYCRKDLVKNADFLAKTPHISHRIRKLVVFDEWWVRRRAHPHENNPFVLGMDFYKSVNQTLGLALRCASKLSTLVLQNLELSLELCRRISEISTLHTLDLHLCRIPRSVRKRLAVDSVPLSSQISNLHIYMDSGFQETHSQWYSLLLCPQIRTLSVVQFGEGAFPTLDTSIWVKCRLTALERFSLDNVDYGDLVELMQFLGNNKTSIAHLTHFKLHMDWGIPDSEVLTLLLALEGAPLEVLVLEGLAEAEFALFARIASQYPDLVALTLIRRQNHNQHQNKLVIWPHASWEYASYLRGFKVLRHFCWNFLTEYWDATPTLLLAFEGGFPSPSENRVLEYDPSDDLPYFLDSHWMALPFAAYCPTLLSFSLMDRTIDMACCITRDLKNGRTILTPKYYPLHSFNSWDSKQWNTTSFHWPLLLPCKYS
ncbi:hypothetical protein B0H34DRAFT_91409 [Crassisporium funariophilum]|nr:hypothetical protein B0H34DRAFT_91409 [Crassisporium funariophilum]